MAADLACLEHHAALDSRDRPEVPRQRAVPPSRLPALADPVAPFGPVLARGDRWQADNATLVVGPAGLPAALTAGDTELLAAPIALQRASGISIHWSPPDIVARAPGGIEWRAIGHSVDGALTVQGRFHFDGLVTVRLHWAGAAAPDRLRLELPLDGARVRHTVQLGREMQPMPRQHRGRWPDPAQTIVPAARVDTVLPYAPALLLADDTVGLQLLSTSDESWHLPEAAAAFRLRRSAQRLNVTVEFGLGASERAVEFALQVLPLRPGPVHTRDLTQLAAQVPDARPFARRARRGQADTDDWPPTLVVHQGWTDRQGYPGAADGRLTEQLEQFVSAGHAAGSRTLVYLGAELPVSLPNWRRIAPEALAVPLRPGRTRAGVVAFRPHGGGEQWLAQHERALRSLLRETRANGVFLDLLGDARASVNPYAGLGYRDANGRMRAETPWFAARDWMHRIARTVRTRDRDGRLTCHTLGPAAPGQGVCDTVLLGEREIAIARQRGAPSTDRLMHPDRLRALYNPHRRGLPMQWLSKPQRGGATLDRNAAATLLMDIPQRTQWPHLVVAGADSSMLSPPADVLRHFAFWRSTAYRARWIPWWAPQPVVADLPSDVYLSSRVAAERGVVEVTVSNLGERARTVDLRFDGTAFGLTGSVRSAREVLGNRPVRRRGAITSVTVPPGQVAVVVMTLAGG